MASRGFITPFTVGFAVCLIPTAFFFVYGYKAPEDRVKELERKGYVAPRQQQQAAAGVDGSASSLRTNSNSNQQLLQAIFDNRNEPDLYRSLQETNRRSAADKLQTTQPVNKP